jgi:hypothetical protein
MRQRTRRIAVLAAAALVGLLAVALLALPRERPVANEPAQPSGSEPARSAATGPLTAEGPPADPLDWADAEWAPVEGALGVGPLLRIDGLIDAGDHLVGWGRVPTPGRNQFNDMGAVFVSADGRSWRAVLVEHGVNAPSTSELYGVAAGPSGYLAFGSVCCEPEGRAVWHSTDLADWTRLMFEGDLDPARFSITALVGSPDGWVAVGHSNDGTRGEIWHSDDGARWDSVFSVEDEMSGFGMADVAMTSNGPIAVGTIIGPDGTYDGAVWTSPDGRDWERVGAEAPVLVGAGETALFSVVPHAGGIYVSGIHGTTDDRRRCEALGMAAPLELGRPTPATSCGWGTDHGWASADGTTWERFDPARAAGEQPIEFRLIVAGGPGLVLLGESSKPDSPDTTLFTSADGRAWTAVGPPQPMGNGTPMALVVRGRQVIAIAEHFDGEQSAWRVWLATVR